MSKPNWQNVHSNSSGYSIGVRANNGDGSQRHRLMVGTATTGLVRIEWLQARFGLVIPTNWSWVQAWQFVGPGTFYPLNYQVDDAQNLICAMAMQGDYDWLLLYEHDNLPAPDALVRINEHMDRGDVPVVSGLYFTRSVPSEPLVYRGRGTGPYTDFDLGDKVWCDGVPTGFLLINMNIIRAMWQESEKYMIGDVAVRRIFETPRRAWYDPEIGQYNVETGTSDLSWCMRIINDGFFEKAGFPEYQGLQYPFLIDTNIVVEHIENDMTGRQFPPGGVRQYWPAYREVRKIHQNPELQQPPTLGIDVSDGVGLGEKVG